MCVRIHICLQVGRWQNLKRYFRLSEMSICLQQVTSRPWTWMAFIRKYRQSEE